MASIFLRTPRNGTSDGTAAREGGLRFGRNSSRMEPRKGKLDDSEGTRRKRETAASTTTSTRTFAEVPTLLRMDRKWKTVQKREKRAKKKVTQSERGPPGLFGSEVRGEDANCSERD
jgi:hypothetical protein